MAIYEIRDTISGPGSTFGDQVIMQRKINLEPGMRHTINHLDWFDDAISGGSAGQPNYKMEVYLTNYPVILRDRIFHTGNGLGGPLAGDDQVLWKAHRLNYSSGNLGWYDAEFPNQFLGATPTFSFYTPTLYWTIIWTQEGEIGYERTFEQSLYLALESKKVDAVEYGIGLLREYNNNQARKLSNNGLTMLQAEVIGAMPMWDIGGIRSELMTGTTSTIGDGNWFLNQAYAGTNGEIMEDSGTIRIQLQESRTMVPSTEAFGSDFLEFPDWFKAIAKPFPSLETGPQRANFPPRRKLTNGNTEMV